ncbi:MAG: lipopolysaccharide assembly protein LapB [Gammaproteobacteria bacterium]|nr:lipopolysaccharide assembly protein LapB [Gammaproteobacteria bacterium]
MTNLSEMPTWLLFTPFILLALLWISRRGRSVKHNKPIKLPPEYFTGLNYLLNDEHGKALDIFVKLVETDWDLVDTHFALGKIFRKNGEIDKAIKIHQGLIARPSLPDEYRSKVLLELGYDYLAAGWFDRAEGLFKEVLIHDSKSEEAKRNLILIFQQEKDWHKAIDVGVDLFLQGASDVGIMVSQYYCELADIAKTKGDVSQVAYNSKQALHYDKGSIRALIFLADHEMDKQNYKQAVHFFEQIEKRDAEFFPVILDKLIECYHRLGDPNKLLSYLAEVESRHQSLAMIEKHAMVIERYQSKDAAIAYLTDRIRKYPDIRGMHSLISYKTNQSDAGELTLLLDLKSALVKMQMDDSEYQCHHCGFQSNTLYWLCPSCQSWAEVKPTMIEAA